MAGKLTGKIAIITGAGSGQGAAMTRLFIEEGAKVVLADINQAGMADVTNDLPDESFRALVCDVSNVDQVRETVAAAVREFGGIDILCNVAGIGRDNASFVELPEDRLIRQFEVNYLGVCLFMKYSIPAMLERGGGSIVNVGSVAGLISGPDNGAFGAMKAAAMFITQSVAASYGAQNIRANAIAPGTVDTPMLRGRMDFALDETVPEAPLDTYSPAALNRIAAPREIAAAALFLASDDASYISGVVLPVDGAWATWAGYGMRTPDERDAIGRMGI